MAFLLPIAGFFGMALGSHILGKAGISVPDINANLLTIPINSNELPGLIGGYAPERIEQISLAIHNITNNSSIQSNNSCLEDWIGF